MKNFKYWLYKNSDEYGRKAMREKYPDINFEQLITEATEEQLSTPIRETQSPQAGSV